jgi:hypothetical protein
MVRGEKVLSAESLVPILDAHAIRGEVVPGQARREKKGGNGAASEARAPSREVVHVWLWQSMRIRSRWADTCIRLFPVYAAPGITIGDKKQAALAGCASSCRLHFGGL